MPVLPARTGPITPGHAPIRPPGRFFRKPPGPRTEQPPGAAPAAPLENPMSAYPTHPRAAFLDWCLVHRPIFEQHAAAIGLRPGQAEAFAAAADAAAAARLAAAEAREAAQLLTARAEEALGRLRAAAGDAVRCIRLRAAADPDPVAIYALAQVRPPADPAPLPPPGQPGRLSVRLEAATGALALRWAAVNPPGSGGTVYLVRRRLPGEAEFAFLAATGRKAHVDETLPAGTEQVEYTVQGLRGRQCGPVSPILTVCFGRRPDGTRTAYARSAAREPRPAAAPRPLAARGLAAAALTPAR